MLQSTRALTTTGALGHSPVLAAPAGEYASVAELFRIFVGFLRRQYPVIVLVFLLAIGLGGLYLYITPSKFSAQARIVIDTRKVQLFQQQPIFGETPGDTV